MYERIYVYVCIMIYGRFRRFPLFAVVTFINFITAFVCLISLILLAFIIALFCLQFINQTGSCVGLSDFLLLINYCVTGICRNFMAVLSAFLKVDRRRCLYVCLLQ